VGVTDTANPSAPRSARLNSQVPVENECAREHVDVKTGLRVAVVAAAPLMRVGLAEMVRGETGVRVSYCVVALDEVGVANDVDAVVMHVGPPLPDLTRLRMMRDRLRIVGVHDGLAPGPMRAVLDAGVAVLVDTSSSSKVLAAAIAGVEQRTLLRWSRPDIGPVPLTRRERSVLALVAGGLTSRDVADALSISARTVEKHKQRIFQRLGVQNQAQAVAIALRAGLLRGVDDEIRSSIAARERSA
jgi:DNA-binding NarL/FixJ family response regulator